jgi:hypothetical protein
MLKTRKRADDTPSRVDVCANMYRFTMFAVVFLDKKVMKYKP